MEALAAVAADSGAVEPQEAGSMKNLAQEFLTKEEQTKVTETVHQVEQTTSGEIVPMLVSSSHHYPVATITGALALTLPTAIILTAPLAKLTGFPPSSMWVFLVLCCICFPAFNYLVKTLPWLKYSFLWVSQVEEEVMEGAVTSFYTEGLHRTKDQNGILIYISVFEKKVWILGDAGINEKIDQSQWDEIIQELSEGIKAGNNCEALCAAIHKTGESLKEHFPIKPDDENELHDLIIK